MRLLQWNMDWFFTFLGGAIGAIVLRVFYDFYFRQKIAAALARSSGYLATKRKKKLARMLLLITASNATSVLSRLYSALIITGLAAASTVCSLFIMLYVDIIGHIHRLIPAYEPQHLRIRFTISGFAIGLFIVSVVVLYRHVRSALFDAKLISETKRSELQQIIEQEIARLDSLYQSKRLVDNSVPLPSVKPDSTS